MQTPIPARKLEAFPDISDESQTPRPDFLENVEDRGDQETPQRSWEAFLRADDYSDTEQVNSASFKEFVRRTNVVADAPGAPDYNSLAGEWSSLFTEIASYDVHAHSEKVCLLAHFEPNSEVTLESLLVTALNANVHFVELEKNPLFLPHLWREFDLYRKRYQANKGTPLGSSEAFAYRGLVELLEGGYSVDLHCMVLGLNDPSPCKVAATLETLFFGRLVNALEQDLLATLYDLGMTMDDGEEFYPIFVRLRKLKFRTEQIYTQFSPLCVVGPVGKTANGYMAALCRQRNRIMHALNGNVLPPRVAGQKRHKMPKRKEQPKRPATAPTYHQARRKHAVENRLVKRPNTAVHVKTVRAEMNRIAYAIASVGSAPPIRWGNAFGDVETAIAAPFTKYNAPWTSTGTANPSLQLPVTDSVIFAFRDYLRSTVQYDCNTALGHGNYTLQGISNLNTLVPVVPQTTFTIPFTAGVVQSLLTPYAIPTAGFSYTPHGAIWPAGVPVSREGRYFWLDVGTVLTIPVTSNISDTAVMGLDLWTPEGIQRYKLTNSVAMVAGTRNVSAFPAIAGSGYYAISVRTLLNPVITFDNVVFDLGTGSHYCHRTLPGFELNYPSIQSMRINAASILYTNRAALQYKEGSIAMVQVPEGDSWMEYTPAGGGFSAVATATQAKEMVAENGMYGFLKPSQASDAEWKVYHTVTNGVLLDCFYPLQPVAQYLCQYQVIDVGLYQNGRITISYSVEFQTMDVWRDVRLANASALLYEEALSQLKRCPQFFENPSHLSDIWNAICGGAKSVASAIANYGPGVIRGASTIASLL